MLRRDERCIRAIGRISVLPSAPMIDADRESTASARCRCAVEALSFAQGDRDEWRTRTRGRYVQAAFISRNNSSEFPLARRPFSAPPPSSSREGATRREETSNCEENASARVFRDSCGIRSANADGYFQGARERL